MATTETSQPDLGELLVEKTRGIIQSATSARSLSKNPMVAHLVTLFQPEEGGPFGRKVERAEKILDNWYGYRLWSEPFCFMGPRDSIIKDAKFVAQNLAQECREFLLADIRRVLVEHGERVKWTTPSLNIFTREDMVPARKLWPSEGTEGIIDEESGIALTLAPFELMFSSSIQAPSWYEYCVRMGKPDLSMRSGMGRFGVSLSRKFTLPSKDKPRYEFVPRLFMGRSTKTTS